MKKRDTEIHKTVHIFMKRCMKYFSIMFVLSLVIVPLYYTSYAMAKQLTINNSGTKLKEGMESLESQIMKSYEITSLLREEREFKRLFFLDGPPPSENYVDINVIQKKLRSLSLTNDLFSNIYITFKENPVFISNYFASDNYENVYGRFLGYSGLSAEEWRSMMYEEKYSEKLMPAKGITSTYYRQGEFQGMTAFINNSYFNGIDQESVLAIVFNQEDIIGKILHEDQRENSFAYITDQNQQILMSSNYPGSEALGDVRNLDEVTVASDKYITLTHKSDMLGLSTVVGIPLHTFQDQVNSLLNLVLYYAIGGTLVILLLSLLYSMKETLWLKKLVDAASKSMKTAYSISNEYSYINHAFSTITTLNEEQLKKLDALNHSMKSSILKHLIILGAHTEKEMLEVRSYFGQQFDRFCIVKVEFEFAESLHLDLSVQQNIGLEFAEALREWLPYEFMTISQHVREYTFVIFLHEPEECGAQHLKERFSQLIRMMTNNSPFPLKINAGISSVASGIKTAKSTYGQAVHALNTNENEVSSGVYTFDYKPGDAAEDKMIFELTLLLKLYDAIIAGESKLVSQMFQDSMNELAAYAPSEQERTQVYYLFRQTVSNANEAIFNDKKKSEEGSALSMPEFHQASDVNKLMNELMLIAIRLCETVSNHRKSNNEKLKEDMLAFIDTHLADSALSASGIADQLMISEKYVYAFVKEQTGKSLSKYIEEKRVAKAERLLLETDAPNSSVLKECGFGSENTFYRAFSKKHGVSPAVWRKNHGNLTE